MTKHRESGRSRARHRVALAICAVLVAAGAWWFLLARIDSNTQSANSSNASALRAIDRARNTLENHNNSLLGPSKTHTHGIAQALNFSSSADYQPSAHWFDATERSADGKFAPSNTSLSFDASCKPYAEAKYTTLETAIAREVEFDPAQATPVDVQVQEIAQFWRVGESFYKIAGVWERDQPATYRVKLFAASSADFESDLRIMPLPEGLPARTDLLTLSDAIEHEVERATAAGGARGARLVQVFYPAKNGEQTLEVKLHNGRAVSWMFGHGRCQLREAGDAYCRCIARESNDHAHSHEPQSAVPTKDAKEKPYRVHD